MMTLRFGVACAAALMCAQSGLAQTRVMQFDMNNLAFQARNGQGAPAAFGGLSHTGSIVFSEQLPTSELVSVLMRAGAGPFVPQPGTPWALSTSTLTITLNNGVVTGGSMNLEIDGGPSLGGDSYSASINPGGTVNTFVGGGFTIEGLASDGLFSDTSFGPVGVADFVSAQTGAPFLNGSFLAFRIQPNANGAGYADIDAFVSNIPAPGSLALLGVGMIFGARRRR